MIRRTAIVIAASATLLAPAVATAPEAQARPVIDAPSYCGPGFYPHAEYAYCKPKAMELARPEDTGWGAIGVAALGILGLIMSVTP